MLDSARRTIRSSVPCRSSTRDEPLLVIQVEACHRLHWSVKWTARLAVLGNLEVGRHQPLHRTSVAVADADPHFDQPRWRAEWGPLILGGRRGADCRCGG